MSLLVLQTAMSTMAVSGIPSDVASTATALAVTGLQYEGDGTPGLSVQTVVLARCLGVRVTVTGLGATCWVTTAPSRVPSASINQAVMG